MRSVVRKAHDMFVPIGKISYREAASLIARHIAKTVSRERPGLPTTEPGFLQVSLELLGRVLAADLLTAWGIVTTSWVVVDHRYRVGDEIKLSARIWRRPEVRRLMIEPAENGWRPGEFAYLDSGGRVFAVLDENQLGRYIDSTWPEQSALEVVVTQQSVI